MGILQILSKSLTAAIPDGDNTYLVFKKGSFPKLDAGQIDVLISNKFPNIISREEEKVNGVSVTIDEIIIALNIVPTKLQVEKIKTFLEGID
jgi:hypothetical protein